MSNRQISVLTSLLNHAATALVRKIEYITVQILATASIFDKKALLLSGAFIGRIPFINQS